VHAFDPTSDYVCGLCHVPSRAGKTKKTAVAATDLLP
jgi:flagellar transcriptional activator FlhC